MTKTTLKTLALVVALFSLAVAKETKFADKRDGKVYATTKIGKQVWMAENLNYAMDSSWCYKDDPANCKKYGRLYTWDAAMKACPKGWHLPTKEEWGALGSAIGEEAGTKLKSKEWDGSDALGFNALPAGQRFGSGQHAVGDRRYGEGDAYGMGTVARFWAATVFEYDDETVYISVLGSNHAILATGGLSTKDDALSVRCVKD